MLKELEANWYDSGEEVEPPVGLLLSSPFLASQGPGTVGSIGKEESKACMGTSCSAPAGTVVACKLPQA